MSWMDRIMSRGKKKSQEKQTALNSVSSTMTPLRDANLGISIRFFSDQGKKTLSMPEILPPLVSNVMTSLLQMELEDLVDEGHALWRDEHKDYLLPYEALAQASEDRLAGLGLPIAKRWTLKVDTLGVIGSESLKLAARWSAPDGRYDVTRNSEYIEVACGLLDLKTGSLHVMPDELISMSQLVREANARVLTKSEWYEVLAHIQALDRGYSKRQESTGFEPENNIAMDMQIRSEDYLAPDRIEVDLRPMPDGGIELRPLVQGYDTFEKAAALADAPSERHAFHFTNDEGKRVRVALPERTRREIERVRSKRYVPAEDVLRFVQNPRHYLQPPEELDEGNTGGEDLFEVDALDLSRIAARVAEYNIEDYASRVVAIEDEEHASIKRQTPFGLGDDWLGPQLHDDLPELNLLEEELQDEDVEPDLFAPPVRMVLKTSENIEELTYEEERAQRLRRAFGELKLSQFFTATLFDYQEEGYAWLMALHEARDERPGGLLADDMGLGKTVQVIALLCAMKERNTLGPSLFVVPKTVISNWRQELRKFCSARLSILEHVGSSRSKDRHVLECMDIIITTYDTLVRDQLLLGKLKLGLLLLDEAQYIKNYTTKRAAAARAMNASLRLALTATPVENNLDELWSILDFTQPGLLGTLTDFRTTFASPLEVSASEDDSASYEHLSRSLLQTMDGHYLRRTKQGVLSQRLPSKHIHYEDVSMTPVQRRLYDDVRHWYATTSASMLPAIHTMLAVCAHPYCGSERVLLGLNHPSRLDEIMCSRQSLIESSGKFEWLASKLADIKTLDEKVILFSSVRRVQSMLRELVRMEFDMTPAVINGDVSGERRQGIIDHFNQAKGFRVIILSAKAAGVGVNVTGANHVIHMTREWNPAKENQATDRAYRIGQTRAVHVYVPVTRAPDFDTIDARLDTLLESKQRLATHVIRPSAEIGVQWKELEACVKEIK